MKPLKIADVVRDKTTNLLFLITGYLAGSETYKALIYYVTPKRKLVRTRRAYIPLKVAETKAGAGAYELYPAAATVPPQIVSALNAEYPTLWWR